MSDTTNDRPQNTGGYQPEAQTQRWVKYGSNVALAVVLVIVLAGLFTYIAQAHDWRLDTSAEGFNSLKPQSLNLIHNLNQEVKLVSLYEKATSNTNEEGDHPLDKAAMVSDLLDNYKRNSPRVSLAIVDPTDKNKVDDLVSELYQRYGKEVSSFKTFLRDYDAKYRQLTQLTTAESAQMTALNNDAGGLPQNEVGESVAAIIKTIQKIPDLLRDNKDSIDQRMRQKHPDYKAVTSSISQTLEDVSKLEDAISKFFEQHKNDKDIPQSIRGNMDKSIPRHKEVQKIADEQVARIGKLGELKVDELRRALNVPNPILVLGDHDWRILSESQVWPTNTAAQRWTDGKLRPNFAGEQQVTTAIFSLTQNNKPKVVFLRAGGAPLTSPGFPPFQPSGPLSDIAARLRQYNFDVSEKDMSGQWAMQSQMRGMPSAPEPDWNQIEQAVWVVLDTQGGPSGPEAVGPKLAEHLGHGGAAMVLAEVRADALSTPLRDWGVELYPDTVAVHEQVQAPEGPDSTNDPALEAQRISFIWDIRDYGSHELARPLRNLESIVFPIVVVKSHEVRGYSATPLIPIPDAPSAPRSWGESDIENLGPGSPPTYDAKKDMAGPLYGGAAVEKLGGGRLVVIGCQRFMFDDFQEIPNLQIARTERRFVARFPGNAELAMNSIFWLAKMDTMIAISPSAMQVSRIAGMGGPLLEFWRIGVLLVILPGLVIAGGIGVFLARRD